MDKKEARSYALKERKSITYDNQALLKELTPYFYNKRVVGIYYPLKDELDLRFLEKAFPNIKFVYPAIINNEIIFKEKGNKWNKGLFNINEPTGNVVLKNDIDLIITPLLCINKNNYRIGYGKGFYDKYLNDYKGMTLAVIKTTLVIDFKEEPHDVRIKEVIVL